MKVVILGATGMVGQGVLRECLLDPDVESVLAIVRNASLPQHVKLREIVHQDVSDLSAIEDRLAGFDACFFCLGVSAVGMKEEEYRRLTFDLTVSVARTLAKLNPTMTFIYVSGAGTDSTERGRLMWARVKAERKTRCWKCRSRLSTCFAQLTFSPFMVFARRRRGTAHFTLL
jgi:putative NADH-flavin reductase